MSKMEVVFCDNVRPTAERFIYIYEIPTNTLTKPLSVNVNPSFLLPERIGSKGKGVEVNVCLIFFHL